MSEVNTCTYPTGDWWPNQWIYPSYQWTYPTNTYYTQIDWDKLEGLVRRVVREELEKRERNV
jgi:hypothetical protein